MRYSNSEISEILKKVALALEIKGEQFFRIRAYKDAAQNSDHFSGSIYGYWQEGKLEEVPGIGTSIAQHLAEYFDKGKSKHFDSLMKDIPDVVFELDNVPGIGAKTAMKLVEELNISSFNDVLDAAKLGKIAVVEGLGKKSQEKIKYSVEGYLAKQEKDERMLLYKADIIIESFLAAIPKNTVITKIIPVGSVRRRVPTVGDFDFAIETDNPTEVEKLFENHPDIVSISSKGEFKITLNHREGYRIDILMETASSFPSLLQHFTGSKAHNVLLRKKANNMGYSLSEHGIKLLSSEGKEGSDQIVLVGSEEELYELLKLQYIPPELREGTDEIELAEKGQIPGIISLSDVRGDLHVHSNFDVEPSHDLGENTVEDIAHKAHARGYSYIGIADHNPAIGTHTEDEVLAIIKKRKDHIEHINTIIDYIEVINCMEVDILADKSIAVSGSSLEHLTFVIAGIHSGHNQKKEQIMERLKMAIIHPHVHMISHPTGRLINERESYEADWDEIFELCQKHHTILEINSAPQRLDLPDFLVKQAKEHNVKFCIDTDSHAVETLTFMRYGVDVARRGWCTLEDIVNTWSWEKIVDYLREGGKKI
ncbi:DNA polymerase/3'-5' exonuclease PolX [candidate division WWE3 bacterium]|uniref:DNA polymerase beta n=1 Tax=candidate division WWE3 bacterium TaxID=2053526 RepID=A0A955RWC7_UNCKA|nr:DNA polymerase/3'-5' exonuclease PolX [candidate division WWE3 bacterium]